MANKVLHKRGISTPSAEVLDVGEIAINTTNGLVFTKTAGGTVVTINGGSSSFETVSKNLDAYPATLAYASGNLSSITYALGGLLTIVKTFNYTGTDLTSIVLSGDTPAGISLTKTLTYSAGNLVGITYS
jgi:hypothetical protein